MTLKEIANGVVKMIRAVFSFEVLNAALLAVAFLLILYIALLTWTYFSTRQEVPDIKNRHCRRVKPAYSWKWEWEAVM